MRYNLFYRLCRYIFWRARAVSSHILVRGLFCSKASISPLALIQLREKGSIHLERKVVLASTVKLVAIGEINVGLGTTINNYSRLVSHSKITIGTNCMLGQFVTIVDHNHDYVVENGRLSFRGYTRQEIVIGNNVWLADKVTVTKGVSICSNVIVGANSVVSKSINSPGVYVGSPAKLVKKIV